jgi:mannose-6-phosphate isomerase-like protein (cupin superfamily)
MTAIGTSINLDQKFSTFTEHWRPKVVASLNGQEVRIVKVQGEFPWHRHDHEDELFLVWKGRFRVEFRDRIVELRTAAGEEAEVILFEPAATRNTGNVESEIYTAPNQVEI